MEQLAASLQSTDASSNALLELPDVVRGVGMLDLLDQDPRPTFVLNTKTVDFESEYGIFPVYWNSAMAAGNSEAFQPNTLTNTVDAHEPGIEAGKLLEISRFRSLILGEGATSDRFFYHGLVCNRVVVASRWMVVSGFSAETSTLNQRDKPNDEVSSIVSSRKLSRTKAAIFVWTD